MTSCICENPEYYTKSAPRCKVWIIVNDMYKYWFINYNKEATLMQDVNNRGNGRVGGGQLYGSLCTICSIIL